MTFYVYDAAGQRVRKVAKHTVMSGPGTKAHERIYIGAFEVYREYGPGGGVTLERETLNVFNSEHRLALVEACTVGTDRGPGELIRYQLANHLDSSILELDQDAQIISYEEYYPYGSTSYQAVRAGVEAPKRYRYTGRERDTETGLYYESARYYAPWLGRWASCDPSGPRDDLNLYNYVKGNPVAAVDRTGLDADKVVDQSDPNGGNLQDGGVPEQTPPPAGPAPDGAAPPATDNAASSAQPAPADGGTPPAAPAPSATPPSKDSPTRSDAVPTPTTSQTAGSGHVIPPPPPVSPPDMTLYVPPGFVWTQYTAAFNEMLNSDNPWWVRGGFGALAVLSAPLAGAEEYIGRPIANVPFIVENAGIGIGEHAARAYEWAQQGEYGEATVDVLESISDFSVGFDSAATVAAPVAGALESQLKPPTELPNSGPIARSVGAMSRAEYMARKLGLNLNSPTTRQLLNSLDMRVEDFIAKYRLGTIWGKLGTEVRGMTVEEAIQSSSTARKVLIDGRFAKQ